jgi:hypothetical protein
MPFTPNDYVLDQLITLIELWKDRSASDSDEDTNSSKILPTSIKTKKFISMIRGGLSKEMLIKYWENVPALQELIEKPNFDEITLKTDDTDLDTDTLQQPQEPTDQMPMEPELQIPDTDMTEPGAAGTPETVPAEEPAAPTGPGPKDIVAQMAQRRKNRVMEQARKYLKTL